MLRRCTFGVVVGVVVEEEVIAGPATALVVMVYAFFEVVFGEGENVTDCAEDADAVIRLRVRVDAAASMADGGGCGVPPTGRAAGRAGRSGDGGCVFDIIVMEEVGKKKKRRDSPKAKFEKTSTYCYFKYNPRQVPVCPLLVWVCRCVCLVVLV